MWRNAITVRAPRNDPITWLERCPPTAIASSNNGGATRRYDHTANTWIGMAIAKPRRKRGSITARPTAVIAIVKTDVANVGRTDDIASDTL